MTTQKIYNSSFLVKDIIGICSFSTILSKEEFWGEYSQVQIPLKGGMSKKKIL